MDKRIESFFHLLPNAQRAKVKEDWDRQFLKTLEVLRDTQAQIVEERKWTQECSEDRHCDDDVFFCTCCLRDNICEKCVQRNERHAEFAGDDYCQDCFEECPTDYCEYRKVFKCSKCYNDFRDEEEGTWTDISGFERFVCTKCFQSVME